MKLRLWVYELGQFIEQEVELTHDALLVLLAAIDGHFWAQQVDALPLGEVTIIASDDAQYHFTKTKEWEKIFRIGLVHISFRYENIDRLKLALKEEEDNLLDNLRVQMSELTPRQQFEMFKRYYSGKKLYSEGVFEPNRKTGRDVLILAAERGYPKAQYLVGLCLENVNKLVEAIRYYIAAAEQGIAGAENSLVRCYVKKEKLGDIHAQYSLANLLMKRATKEEQNQTERTKLLKASLSRYKKAAGQGHIPSQACLVNIQSNFLCNLMHTVNQNIQGANETDRWTHDKTGPKITLLLALEALLMDKPDLTQVQYDIILALAETLYSKQRHRFTLFEPDSAREFRSGLSALGMDAPKYEIGLSAAQMLKLLEVSGGGTVCGNLGVFIAQQEEGALQLKAPSKGA